MTTPEAREASPLPLPEERPQNAADILTRELPHKTAYNFINSCALVADAIDKRHPNFVFIPLRGAGPIQWVVEEFIEGAGKKMPEFVELPIGTHTSGDSRKPSGIGGLQKRQLIQETIDRLASRPDENHRYKPGESRVVLIDEVQKGGTITQAAQALHDAIADVREKAGIKTWNKDRDDIYILAAQDSRSAVQKDRKSSYMKLLAGREGFSTIPIPTIMFMVDRPEFLDEIVKVGEGPVTSLSDFEIKRNHVARHLFKTMAHVFLHPKQALEELEDLHIQKVAQDLSKTVLQAEMLEALTNPFPVKYGRGATESHTFDWWLNFCKYAVKERNGNGHAALATDQSEPQA